MKIAINQHTMLKKNLSVYKLIIPILIWRGIQAASAQERPQTPVPPFPYQSLDVFYTVKTDTAVHLAATLTIPEGKGPFPAVVIIGGSGQFPRDQPFYRHKVSMVLADYLTKKGFATLRFDDRGAGKSTAGNKKQRELVEADLVAAAGAGFDFLKTHQAIDPKRIGLIGMSAGAGQGVELASQADRNAYFAIMLSGAAKTPPHLIVQQQSKLMAKAEGRSLAVQKADSSFIAKSISYTVKEPVYENRLSAIQKIADDELETIPQPERDAVKKGFYTRARILASGQFYQAAQETHEDYLLKIKCLGCSVCKSVSKRIRTWTHK